MSQCSPCDAPHENGRCTVHAPTNENEDIDAIICLGVPYMNEGWALYPDDRAHMLAGFRRTNGYKEAKASLERWKNQRVIEELGAISTSNEWSSIKLRGMMDKRIAQLRQQGVAR